MFPILTVSGSVAFRPCRALFTSSQKVREALTSCHYRTCSGVFCCRLVTSPASASAMPWQMPAKPLAATRAGPAEAGTWSSKDDITGGSLEVERKKLVFFEGRTYSFDLEDLLRASAEVLGKGSVGTSYKAVLEEGTTVVVKRLKDVAVTKKNLDAQMEVLGKIKHENVVPLRAYYYSKDEKLLVYDFLPSGSSSALLHDLLPDELQRRGVLPLADSRYSSRLSSSSSS